MGSFATEQHCIRCYSYLHTLYVHIADPIFWKKKKKAWIYVHFYISKSLQAEISFLHSAIIRKRKKILEGYLKASVHCLFSLSTSSQYVACLNTIKISWKRKNSKFLHIWQYHFIEFALHWCRNKLSMTSKCHIPFRWNVCYSFFPCLFVPYEFSVIKVDVTCFSLFKIDKQMGSSFHLRNLSIKYFEWRVTSGNQMENPKINNIMKENFHVE